MKDESDLEVEENTVSDKENRVIKKENARTRLLKQLDDGDFRTLLSRVAFVMNHYPETRDSDLVLTLRYWETFQNDLYNNGMITNENYLKLEQQSDITRARAKVQNDIGAFEASEDVKNIRTEREKVYKSDQIEISESAVPITRIFCDESGKTQDTVLVGSLWGHGDSLDTIRDLITAFRAEHEWKPKDEFHFVDVNKNNIEQYKWLVDVVAEHSSTIGFKAICFKKAGSVQKIDDIVTNLYLVGLCDGLSHEVETGRVVVPRTINIVKDREDAKDNLILEKQILEVETHIKMRFNHKVNLGYFMAAPSYSNFFLQVADVFTGCLNRKINTPLGNNAKDDLANYFFDKFSIDLQTLTSEKYDFIEIRYLN
jgi:hypothetical protein